MRMRNPVLRDISKAKDERNFILDTPVDRHGELLVGSVRRDGGNPRITSTSIN